MLPSQQELSDLLGTLYDASANPDLWNSFLVQVARYAPASSAALVFHDLERSTCRVSSSWNLDPRANQLYQAHYHSVDVWAQRLWCRPVGVSTSQSICPLSELRNTEIYNDFLRQEGIEHAIFGVLTHNKSCLGAISLYRTSSQPEFEQSEIEILEFMAPHLQRAFRLFLQLTEARAHTVGAQAALDMLSTGVILLGPGGEIVFMNRSAAALVAARDGLLATRFGLRAERPAETSLMEKAVRQALAIARRKDHVAADTVFVSRRDGPALQVFVTPFLSSAMNSFPTVAAIALVADPLRATRPAPSVLRTLYGLTTAECRVALLLSDGYAPREIAEKVGVTNNTVRSQIKSIFLKTGVKRQGELIRLLLNSVGPGVED